MHSPQFLQEFSYLMAVHGTHACLPLLCLSRVPAGMMRDETHGELSRACLEPS